MIRRLSKISGWLISLLAVSVLVGFSHKAEEEQAHRNTHIVIDYSGQNYFLLKEEVEDIFNSYYDSLFLKPFKIINIRLLEEKINALDCVKKADVFSTVNGILCAEVKLREPLIRIFDENKSYYIDKQGSKMPLSPHFSAPVPVVTGRVDSSLQAGLHAIFTAIDGHGLFREFITGAEINDGEFVLLPKRGRHRIHFGHAKGISYKLKKLELFYKRAADSATLAGISSINLKYGNQVVCKKN